MTYPLIEIANQSRVFSDVTVGSILTISKIKESRYESKLTAILTDILGTEVDVLRMTAEERYCHFLSYLNLTIESNALYQKTNPLDYLSDDLNAFSTERVKSDVLDMSVRHLTGIEATALEIGCESTEDWILGEMAITIGLDERLPELDIPTSLDFTSKSIFNRINTIKEFTTHEFNTLYEEYLNLKSRQTHLVSMVFDNGIVLEKFNLRGADDAPCRFCAAHAFTGFSKELLSIALGGTATV